VKPTVPALLLLAGCFLGPSNSLDGRWGGQGVALDARASDVRLDFLCSQAIAPKLAIDGAGRFAGTAEVTAVSWAGPRPSILRLSGTIENGVMSLDVATVWPPQGGQADTMTSFHSYTLVHGSSGDFSGIGCLL
jgi:hypothetical protein